MMKKAMPKIIIVPGTSYWLISQLDNGAAYTDANPKPETTIPAIMPIFVAGNHFTAGGVAEA